MALKPSSIKRIYRGWWVLGACVAMQVLTANFTMQSFGAYIAVIQQEFGWSSTALAAAFAIQQALGGFLGPLFGWILQRVGPRHMIRLGLIIFCVGLILLSFITSLWSLYAVVIVIATGASLAGFLPLNTVAVQWFSRWRSTALALMQVGISIGGLLVPLVAWSLNANGWRPTAIATSIIVLIIGLPLSFVIGNKPEDYGLEPDGLPAKKTALQDAAHDFTAKEAFRTRAFWFISLGHGLALAAVFSVLAHMVLFLTTERSFSLQMAGNMIALMTTMSIIGQLLGGFLGDRLEKRLIACFAMLGHAAGLIMLAFGQDIFWIYGFSVVHGLSWGLRGPIMQALRADYFGRTHFGQILGLSSPIVTVGMVGGPLLLGILADQQGSYFWGLITLAVLAVIGSVFFIFASAPKSKAAFNSNFS